MIESDLFPSEPPPAIAVRANVTVTPGSRAVLTCHVVSTVNFNLTWLRAGHDARLDPRVHVLANLSLQVSSVSPDQSGWYECVAINEGGVTAERIFLTVEGNNGSSFSHHIGLHVSRPDYIVQNSRLCVSISL